MKCLWYMVINLPHACIIMYRVCFVSLPTNAAGQSSGPDSDGLSSMGHKQAHGEQCTIVYKFITMK